MANLYSNKIQIFLASSSGSRTCVICNDKITSQTIIVDGYDHESFVTHTKCARELTTALATRLDEMHF